MNNMKSILWGVVLVLLGVLVGTNSLGITNIDIFFDGWWSLFIIIPCFIGLFSNEDKTGNIIGLLVGVILLLGMNDILDLDKIWKLIDYRRDFTTSKYSSELDIIVNENNTITNALNSSFDGYILYKTFGDLIIIDGKEYISSLCYKGNEIGALLIDYDFDNNKVLNYKYTLRDN